MGEGFKSLQADTCGVDKAALVLHKERVMERISAKRTNNPVSQMSWRGICAFTVRPASSLLPKGNLDTQYALEQHGETRPPGG